MYLEQSRIPDAESLSRDKSEHGRTGFHAVFERVAGQPLPRAANLDAATRSLTLEEGDPLFEAGNVDRRIHVVLEGFLTLKYISPDGACWVKGFVPPGVPFACVSCLDCMPAPFMACAGSRTSLVSVPFAELDRLTLASMAWQRAVSNAFKIYGQRKEKREMELLMLSAEARYLGFLQEMPDIADRLKLHEIASYIRVTPVSLSRIRRRLGMTPAGSPSRIGEAKVP
jgi:CRP-like cAMP-binding protein